jgi:hypothetical protein
MKTEHKLFVKYLALLTALALLPLWLAGRHVVGSGAYSVDTALMELQLARAGAAARAMEAYAADFSARTGRLRDGFQTGGWQGKIQILSNYVDANNGVKSVSVVTRLGRELVKAMPGGGGELESRAGAKDFAAASAEGAAVVYLDAAGGRLISWHGLGDHFLRVEAALPDAGKLFPRRTADGGLMVLSDSEGRTFLLQDGKGEGMMLPFPKAGKWPVIKSPAAYSLAGFAVPFDYDGVRMLGAGVPLGYLGGALAVAMPLEDAHRYVRFSAGRGRFFVNGAALIVFIALAVFCRRLSRRLAAEKAAPSGDTP